MGIGQSPLRLEDEPLLRGRGRFLDDIEPGPDTLHVAFVRSPYAAARIERIDTTAAAALDGVAAVLTGRDVAARIGVISADFDHPGFKVTYRQAMPMDRVRFVGDTVAMVLATDPYIALDAAELVELDLVALPAVADLDAALAPAAPHVHDEAAGNVVFEGSFASDGFAAAQDAAPLRLRETFTAARQAAVSIEPRGCIATWTDATRELVMWTSTQVPHLVRAALCEYLGLDAARVRVIVPDVGGGFGMKTVVYPEELLVAAAAMMHGRPVKWVQDRYDDFLASAHARDQRYTLDVGFDAHGRLQTLAADVVVNIGAYASLPFGSSLEANGGPRNLPGPYTLQHFSYRTRAVLSNTCPTGAYRGVSAPVSCMALESMLDRIARHLALDPTEVRRRNLVATFPYRNVLGLEYGDGCFLPMLERALVLVDYAGLRSRQRAQAPDARRRLGIGMSVTTEQTGMGAARYRARGLFRIPGYESATVRLAEDGTVLACVSQATQGQGHVTAFTQIVAGELDVDLDVVRVVEGDTGRPVEGSGTFASRGIAIAGTAVLRASRQLRENICSIAARLLDCAPESVHLARGEARSRERAVSLREIAATAAKAGGDVPPLEVTIRHDPPSVVLAATVHVASLEVDVATGEVTVRSYAVVHDCGRMVNPMMVDGQIQGAAVQGIGEVLMEAVRYDSEGQPLTVSLMDYEIPRSIDVTPMAIESMHSSDGGRVFKGVGESGTIGAVPALTSAVADALAARRVCVNRLPLTSAAIRALLAQDAA